ncbi:MAG: hypothetical protein ACLFUC_04775 [Bacteroidales bacterium]
MEKYKTVAVHARSTYWTNHESSDEMTVDADDLAKEMMVVMNNLDKEGYEIMSITPISSGNISGGTGYYQSESVIITARKKQ